MKLKTLLLTGLAGIALTACTTTPKTPTLELGVLEKVTNIDVYPNTKSNKAQLVKFPDHCIIEFSAVIEAGRANEKWQFKGNNLISASSTIFAKDGTSTGEAFDLYDKQKQDSFIALKNNFKKENIAACE
jgi:hypothetical protein